MTETTERRPVWDLGLLYSMNIRHSPILVCHGSLNSQRPASLERRHFDNKRDFFCEFVTHFHIVIERSSKLPLSR